MNNPRCMIVRLWVGALGTVFMVAVASFHLAHINTMMRYAGELAMFGFLFFLTLIIREYYLWDNSEEGRTKQELRRARSGVFDRTWIAPWLPYGHRKGWTEDELP